MAEIKYFGHSCFYIKGKEFSVVTDPFSGIGYEMPKITADYCTVSHGHFDHAATDKVNARVIKGENAAFTGEKLPFTAIKTYHDNEKGALRGVNYAFKFCLDGVTFCHLGDLGEKFSEEAAKKIGNTDVLFIPVGGNYTVDGEQAEKFARAIDPYIIIPMHYKTPRSKIDISAADDFCSRFNAVIKKDDEISIEKADLKEELTVWLLDSSNF